MKKPDRPGRHRDAQSNHANAPALTAIMALAHVARLELLARTGTVFTIFPNFH
jgi:hypothetical protein